jgi:hypothetical protein
MAKPSGNLPTWATTPGNRIEPGSGKKAEGWQTGERPSAQFMNWLQGLAGDWIAYLNDVVGGVAIDDLRLNSSITDVTQAPFRTSTSPEDYGPVPTTLWKLIGSFGAGTGRTARIYTGRLSGASFIITINCFWSPGSGGLWFQQVSSQPSLGLEFSSNGLGIRVVRVDAGTASWNQLSWGAGSLGAFNAQFTGEITAQDIHVLDDVDIDSDLNVDGNAQVDGTMNAGLYTSSSGYQATTSFGYATPQSKVMTFSPALCQIQGPAAYVSASDRILGDAGGTSVATWALDLPSGFTLTKVDVMVTSVTNSSTGMPVVVRKNTQTDWSATPANGGTMSSLASGGNAFNGLQVITHSGLTETIARATERVQVQVTVEDSSTSQVHGLRITGTFAGPRQD